MRTIQLVAVLSARFHFGNVSAWLHCMQIYTCDEILVLVDFEKDTEKEDAMGMLLMEKKSYGATGRRLTSEVIQWSTDMFSFTYQVSLQMRIVVTGCRVETSVGGCDGYPLALILDEAASGTVFVSGLFTSEAFQSIARGRPLFSGRQ